MSDILGYARVSTQQQDLDSQKNRLTKAGAIKIFEDVRYWTDFSRQIFTNFASLFIRRF